MKAQAAMEYLMTYGWAILIIIVVVAALYAMGVFKGGGTVPCSPCFSYFAFKDHNKTHLILTNGANTIEDLQVVAGGSTPGTNSYNPGDTIIIPLSSFSAPHNVTISYSVTGGTAGHIDMAMLH